MYIAVPGRQTRAVTIYIPQVPTVYLTRQTTTGANSLTSNRAMEPTASSPAFNVYREFDHCFAAMHPLARGSSSLSR